MTRGAKQNGARAAFGVHAFAVTMNVGIALAVVAPLVAVLGGSTSMARTATESIGLPLMNSLLLATLTTVLALLLGVLGAWAIAGLPVRYRGALLGMLSIPVVLPSYLIGLAWAPWLSPSGLVIQPIALQPTLELRALASAAWVLAVAYFPLVLWAMHWMRERWTSALEEAQELAAVAGRTRLVMRLRWYAPAFGLAALFVWLLALADFSVADYYGVRTQSAEIFAMLSMSLDPQAALRSAVPLLAVSALVLAAAASVLLVSRRRWQVSAMSVAQAAARDAAAPTARGRGSSGGRVLVCGVLLTVTAFVPILLLVQTIVDGRTPIGVLLTFTSTGVAEDLFGSAVLGLTAGVATALLATAVGYLAVCGHGSARWLGRYGIAAVFVLPVAVWGMGVATLTNRALPTMTFSVAVVLLALTVALHGLMPSVEFIASRARAVPIAQREAALVHGVHGLARLRWIEWPTLRHATAWVGMWGALWALNTVALVVLLAPPGFSTLMLRIYQTVHYGPPELLALLCLLQFSIVAAWVSLAWLILRVVHRRARSWR